MMHWRRFSGPKSVFLPLLLLLAIKTILTKVRRSRLIQLRSCEPCRRLFQRKGLRVRCTPPTLASGGMAVLDQTKMGESTLGPTARLSMSLLHVTSTTTSTLPVTPVVVETGKEFREVKTMILIMRLAPRVVAEIELSLALATIAPHAGNLWAIVSGSNRQVGQMTMRKVNETRTRSSSQTPELS